VRDAACYLLASAAINLGVYDWTIESGAVEHPPLGRQIRRRWAEQPRSADAWTRITPMNAMRGMLDVPEH
jgi:hypothetical protein